MTHLKDEKAREICLFAKFLFPIVMGPSKLSNTHEVPVLTPKELLSFALRDQRILTRFVYALATGIVNINLGLLTSSTDHQSQFPACFVAAELMVRSMSDKPGYLQSTLTDQLNIQLPSRGFTNFCSAFRISGSWSWINRGKAKLTMIRFEDGKEVGLYDLFVFGGDNVQFGKRGCIPWTIFLNKVLQNMKGEVLNTRTLFISSGGSVRTSNFILTYNYEQQNVVD